MTRKDPGAPPVALPGGDSAPACPQCGGVVQPREEDGFLDCGFCGSRLYWESVARRHEYLAPVLDAAAALRSLRHCLADREIQGQPEDLASRLCFFPFWLLPGAHGLKPLPAAATLVEGLADFHCPAGDRRAFDATVMAARGLVVPASVANPSGDQSARSSLVHVPFWELDFRVWSRACRVWVDAVSGQVLVDVVPASAERRLDRLYFGALLATLAALALGFRLLFAGGVSGLAGGGLLIALGPLASRGVRALIRRGESA